MISHKKYRPLIYALCMIFLTGLVSSCQGTPSPVTPQTVVPPTTLPPTAPGNSCSPEDIAIFLSQADRLLEEFDALGALVDTTPPEDLLPLIQDMDALSKNTAAFIQIPCALKAQAALSEYFSLMI